MAYPMKYVNHLGEEVRFDAGTPYGYNETDLRSTRWTAEDMNGTVAWMEREPRDYELEVFVNGEKGDCDALDDVFEADAGANVDGTLEAGGWKLRCRRTESSPSSWAYVGGYMRSSLMLHSARPVWSRDVMLHYEGTTEYADERDLDNCHPHGYPHGYGPSALNHSVTSSASGSSDFLLRVFGPCANPYVIIGGNRYECAVTLSDGARLEIDTRDKTAVHVMVDGQRANVFDKLTNGMRDGGEYAFQPLPRGESAVTWPGSFSFDVVVHEERSAPRW